MNAVEPTSPWRQPAFAALALWVSVLHVWGVVQFAHWLRQPVWVARVVRAVQVPYPGSISAAKTEASRPIPTARRSAQAPRPRELAKIQSQPQPAAPPAPGPSDQAAVDRIARAASAPETTAGPEDEALTAVWAFVLPPSVRLQYSSTGSARGRALQASSSLVWRQDGQSFEAQMETTQAQGPARQIRSVGLITAEGLSPTRYSDRSRKESATHFVREQGRIVFSTNAPPVELKVAAQDRLSLVFQLSALLAAQPERFGPNANIAIQTAGVRAAETWVFTVGSRETLELPGGRVEALKLTRSSHGAYDPTVEVWLAPTLHYWPVRLRQSQPNGDFLDHQWAGADPL